MLLVKCSIIFVLFLLGCNKQGPETVAENKTVKSDKVLSVDSASPVNYGNMLIGKRRISSYDHLIKRYSRRYGFDWRLICAQVFTESRFRKTAKSPVGALGLMQIMPRTAKHMGVESMLLLFPEHNIRLGCYYDHWLYCLWKEKKSAERLRFMFASYNAGRGRVLRTQRKIHTEDWDSLKIFLPYETQEYVRKIFDKYEQYRRTYF